METTASSLTSLVNSLTLGQRQRSNRHPGRPKQPTGNNTCRNCGGPYPHKNGRQSCPAHGQQCDYCHKLHHFASLCLSKANAAKPNYNTNTARGGKKFNRRSPRVNQVNTASIADGDSSPDDELICSILNKQRQRSPYTTIDICGTPIETMVDSGASVNIMDAKTYRSIPNAAPRKPTTIRIYPYGTNQELPLLGDIVKSKRHARETTFLRCKSRQDASTELRHSSRTRTNQADPINHHHCAHNYKDLDEWDFNQDYPELFTGIGKLASQQVERHIDKTLQPVAQRQRHIPFHLKQQVVKALLDLKSKDVIEKVEGPTPWVFPIVPVPEPHSPEQVRVCVDMRIPNTAVKRERHVTPTLDNIIADVNGSTVFSKLDLNQGYHQLELKPSSRYITCFSSHLGLCRYKRLNFGISSAAEIFQETIHQVINRIPGALNISDDILVHSRTQEDHDRALAAVFKHLSDNHLTLNKTRCAFNKSSLKFFGHIFSASGMSPDPEKVQAICEAPSPESAGELRSLLGMVGYFSRYIEDFAAITNPLRSLTRRNATWQWSTNQQQALETLKHKLTNAPVMSYFDPTKQTELIVDASPMGLGAVFAQKTANSNEPMHVIAYASRSLTDVERRYSQTEREALAIVWGCEHHHLYLYGRTVHSRDGP